MLAERCGDCQIFSGSIDHPCPENITFPIVGMFRAYQRRYLRYDLIARPGPGLDVGKPGYGPCRAHRPTSGDRHQHHNRRPHRIPIIGSNRQLSLGPDVLDDLETKEVVRLRWTRGR